jgi:hypothetical protein
MQEPAKMDKVQQISTFQSENSIAVKWQIPVGAMTGGIPTN